MSEAFSSKCLIQLSKSPGRFEEAKENIKKINEGEVEIITPKKKATHQRNELPDELIEEAEQNPPEDAQPILMLRLPGFTKGAKPGSRRKLK